MSEFCLECYNKYVATEETQVTEDDVVMQYDICEGCKRNLPCVLFIKTPEQKEYERIRKLYE